MNLATTLHVVWLVEVVVASRNATPVMVSEVVPAWANSLNSFGTPARGTLLKDKTNMTTESLLRRLKTINQTISTFVTSTYDGQ